MTHIFISYSHTDREYAHHLAKALEKQGLSVWIDDRIDYGTRWLREIESHIDDCNALIVIMTPRSKESDWVQSEWLYARDKKKLIYALLLDGEAWLAFRSTQYIDVRGDKLPPVRFFDGLAGFVTESSAPAPAKISKPAPARTANEDIFARTIQQHRAAAAASSAESSKPVSTPPMSEDIFARTIQQHRASAEVRSLNVQVWGGVEFIRIPASKFLMGSKPDNPNASADERPQHTVEISYDYWMARYPVTNEQFAKFIEESAYKSNYKFNLEKNWKKKADHPVVDVSWHDAMAYCKWLNTLAGAGFPSERLVLRLPTEAEWEKAARGEYGNEWPWGNDFDKDKCNSAEGKKGGTTPVGAYSPQGDSPYCVADLVGNVWEWCHSLFKPYPYKMDDGREYEWASETRVLRGGSFDFTLWGARCAYRFNLDLPGSRDDYFGFRVVVSPSVG